MINVRMFFYRDSMVQFRNTHFSVVATKLWHTLVGLFV